MKSTHRRLLAPAIALLGAFMQSALAHHTYAMFDNSGTRSVTGTIAKLEWKNPHVYIWMYVPSTAEQGKYDLYAFENGSPSVLSARGWTPTIIKAGDQITIEYWPLKDGRNGGHFEQATFADGHKLRGAGGPGRF